MKIIIKIIKIKILNLKKIINQQIFNYYKEMFKYLRKK